MSDNSQSGEGESVRWTVLVLDRAEQDIESAYLYLSGVAGPESANVWATDLRAAIEGLAGFPGPFACPADEETSRLHGRTTRRLLYRGPKNRPLCTAYPVFYTAAPPENSDDEGQITVLRVRHAARAPFGSDPVNPEPEE